MVRRANTGWRDGSWTVPAGHVEEGEAPSAAAVRELQEEAGVRTSAIHLGQPLIYFYPEDARLNDRVSLFFQVSEYSGTPFNAEPAKADMSQWFDFDDLPQDMPPLLRRALTDINAGVHYSERYYDEELHKELLQ